MKKSKSVVTIIVVVLLIALLSTFVFVGVDFLGVQKLEDGVRLGLDLVGGSRVTYAPVDENDNELSPDADQMDSAIAVMRKRLSMLGFTEASVYTSGSDITVEIPSLSNPEEAVQTLGTTAQVQFKDYTGKTWVSGSQITGAKFAVRDGGKSLTGNTNIVELEFTSEGQALFAQATEFASQQASPNNYIAIYLDDELISQPACRERIEGNAINEMPNSSAEEAVELAQLINSGALPFSLRDTYLETVGASLGEESLSTSLMAGMIGLILVMLFMICVYRVMGVVSCISLCVYGLLFGTIISIAHINLSLPGIAGVILTIGMAVDANVVIFERVKEELRAGKTTSYAVDAGYKRAFWAIFDSNITTIIAAVVLWIFGTGTIVGFAQTLFYGVVLSMIVMLVLTKLLLKAMVGLGINGKKAYAA